LRDHNLEISPELQKISSSESITPDFKKPIDDAAGLKVLPDFQRKFLFVNSWLNFFN